MTIRPPDGLSLRNDLFFLSGDGDRSLRSGRLEADAEVTLIYNYLTLLYKPKFQLLGTGVAFGVTGALGHADIDARVQGGGLTVSAKDDHTGLGDLTLSVYLYRRYHNFHVAWAGFVVAPVGDYDVSDLANTGLNYWTFETDLMVTYFNDKTGQDYSIVIGYGYNTENDDTDYKTGDEFHVDYVFNQHLSTSFGIGVSGFYFRQLSGDKGAGARLGAFRGEAAGIGPSIYWNTNIFGRQVYFSAKWIHEFHTKRRLNTDYIYTSFSLSFG